MDTVMLEPAADFEQRMQQLDALDLSTAGPALASQWPAEDLAHIEREENAAYTRYLQHAQTFVSASVKQLNSTQTFTLRETFLKTVGLISDEEQWAMLQARQENASEALALSRIAVMEPGMCGVMEPVMHLESPAGHLCVSRQKVQRVESWPASIREAVQSAATGSITPIRQWLHNGDHALAPLRRSSAGSNMPITKWLHYAGR